MARRKKDGRRKTRKKTKPKKMPTLIDLIKKNAPQAPPGQVFKDKTKYTRKGRRKDKNSDD
jgi:hypothetical protein